jgi:mRNA interferase RelE/StbE
MREIERLDDPLSRRYGLTENKKGLWRYRMGDWRVLCEIRESELIIHVVTLGNRKDVYT